NGIGVELDTTHGEAPPPRLFAGSPTGLFTREAGKMSLLFGKLEATEPEQEEALVVEEA
ncbi:hypothetical protein LCGC14_2119360, partial [marine sediment metagenome]